MEFEELKELGLSENEAKIYVFLLRRGESTTGPIIKETGIANSRVYDSISSLISKGLASYMMRKEGKVFQAANPKVLVEKEEERRKKASALAQKLSVIQNKKTPKTSAGVFENFDGFKTAFRKIIDECPENGEIQILGFSEMQENSKQLRDFISKMNVKSSAKRQRLKIILGESVRKTFGKDRAKEKFASVRYLPEEFLSPAAIDIVENSVYVFLWEEKPFVFAINNEKIAESFRQYFNFLWKIAK
ncbi:MAG: helix-turn-helix domain-containing protein, partial [Candidatus Diapherotrites archaeon]|nr:helix-turn-helix domain-containing protein [Candidatus Diapherotrites archaeon]